jgi:uncharacterized protein (DUF58 family)
VFGKNHISITLQGWYYLILLAFVLGGALLRDINLLVVIAGIMIGPVVLSALLATFTLRRLTLSRKLPEGISAGDLLVAEISLSNRRRRLGSWAVVVDDAIQRIESTDREGATGRVLFPYVRANETVRVAYRGRLGRRGRYRFGPLRISTRFPFGLVARTVTAVELATVTVVPRLGQLTPLWHKSESWHHVGSQRSRHRQGLVEGEFHGLRDWRSGDSRSWIHWRTTAKRDQLTVRQFERHENQDLTVLVELWHPARPTEGEREIVELAVSFAATVVADQCRRGSSRLEVGTAGTDVRTVSGFASMVTLREVMELLATAESSSRDRLPALLDVALAESRPGTRLVVVSTRPTDLSDTDRFRSVWDDLQKRSTLGKFICLDASSDQFHKYFQLE